MNFIQPRLGNEEVGYDNFFKMHMNNVKQEVKTEPFSSFVPLMKMIEQDEEEDITQRNIAVQYGNNSVPDYYVKPEMSSAFPHNVGGDSFFYGSGIKEEFPNFMTDNINSGHLGSTEGAINDIVNHTYEEIKNFIDHTDDKCHDDVVDSTTNGYEVPQEGKQERLKLTESQRNILLATFNECSHPEIEKINELAKMLSLSVRTVQTWFCKQRYRSSVQQKDKTQIMIEAQQSRLKLTEVQKKILLLEFNKSNLPDPETVNRLSKNLNLSPKSIQTWFANRRYRNTPQKESNSVLNEYSVPPIGADDKNGFAGMMNLQNSLSNMSPATTHIPTYDSSSFSHSLLHNSSPCKSLANAVMNQNDSVKCKTILSYDDDYKQDGNLVIDTQAAVKKGYKTKQEEPPLTELSDEDEELFRRKEREMEKLDESFKPNVPLGYLVPKFNRPSRECKKKPLPENPVDSFPTKTTTITTKTAHSPVSKVDKRKQYNVRKFPAITPPREPRQAQKPKKGMATVKQRLGRILGIHKMKF